MKNVFLILLFSLPRIVFSQHLPQRTYPSYCQSNLLYSNIGKALYRFTFISDCVNALIQSKNNNGRFCDENLLVREDGKVSRQYSFSSECLDGLLDLKVSNRGLYCHDGDLNQIYSGTLAKMAFKSDCKQAISEAAAYRGLFCHRGLMMTYRGQRLKDYSFDSLCRADLPMMSQRFP
jgi:hypothetical protein